MPEPEPVTMDWPDAMRAVKDGLPARRLAWAQIDPLSMVMLKGGRLEIRIKGEWRSWIVSDPDVYAKDWVI
jgi:hypothetical protein